MAKKTPERPVNHIVEGAAFLILFIGYVALQAMVETMCRIGEL